MAPAPLTDDELSAALAERPAWTHTDDAKLRRELTFDDFAEAFAFMTRVAIVADKADHHPEWSNVYNRVTIELTTHDAGGITAADLSLADAVDAFAG